MAGSIRRVAWRPRRRRSANGMGKGRFSDEVLPMTEQQPVGRWPVVRAAIDGLLVVVPIGAIILLVVGILHSLRDATAPLAGQFVHPMVMGLVLFVVLCLGIGYLVRSAIGRAARHALETVLFEKIPGYRLVKAFTGDGPLAGPDGHALLPAIAAFDDMQCPALVMDTFEDGQVLVFVPGSPTSMSGTLHIMSPDRVARLDVPLLPFLKAISSWGLGLSALVPTPPPPRAQP
jgi:uncharacterized membrane protein